MNATDPTSNLTHSEVLACINRVKDAVEHCLQSGDTEAANAFLDIMRGLREVLVLRENEAAHGEAMG